MNIHSLPRCAAAGTLAFAFMAQAAANSGVPATAVATGSLPDVPIEIDRTVQSQLPAVAANPIRPLDLVTVAASTTSSGIRAARCAVHRSTDGGATWAAAGDLPMPSGVSGACGNPDIAYQADGSRLVAVYVVGSGGSLGDVAVTVSQDDGTTWEPAALILQRPPVEPSWCCRYRAPHVAMPRESDEHPWIYVAAFRDGDFAAEAARVEVVRSGDGGATWDDPVTIATSMLGWSFRWQGPAIAAGHDGNVLVAFERADSSVPGVDVVRSANHGQSFGPVLPVIELSGPQRPAPDIVIGNGGSAHLVFARGELRGNGEETRLDTDILYSFSKGPPYRQWSPPVKVNDDPGRDAQDRPRIAAQACHDGTVLHVVWEDRRRRAPSEEHADVFYARKVAGERWGWSRNIRVTDASVPFLFAPALTLRGDAPYAVWSGGTVTQRADLLELFGSPAPTTPRCR